jgi:Rrf2 family protein
MLLSSTATHALRALAHLAHHAGEEAMQGRTLASEVGVPTHYLAKVLATLARSGVLSASRGVRGGYRLARPAEAIRLIEIVEPFEGKRILESSCLLRPCDPCSEDSRCPAHRAWAEVKTAYTRFLDSTTLADLRGRAPEFRAESPRSRTERHRSTRRVKRAVARHRRPSQEPAR